MSFYLSFYKRTLFLNILFDNPKCAYIFLSAKRPHRYINKQSLLTATCTSTILDDLQRSATIPMGVKRFVSWDSALFAFDLSVSVRGNLSVSADHACSYTHVRVCEETILHISSHSYMHELQHIFRRLNPSSLKRDCKVKTEFSC